MTANVGYTDRIIRLLIAIMLLALLMNQMVTGTGAIIIGLIAIMLTLTSIFGSCPIYTLFGIKTP